VLDTTTPKLAEIFKAVLELPAGAEFRDVRQENTAGWDSLAHVVLIGAIESEFDLQVDANDSLGLTSYEAIARYLEERGL
jgi:acyl carrier protein